MVKTFQNLLFQNQNSDDLETWCGAWIIGDLRPGLTLTNIKARSNLRRSPMHLYGEICLKVIEWEKHTAND